jgi:hypothetical protein
VLVELTTDELTLVVGGQATRICPITDPCITPPPYTGLKCLLTDGCV